MRGRSAAPFALLALLALVPAAAAQHEHMAMGAAVIAHDADAAGDEWVGNLAHFAVLDLGDDAVPDFHQQNHIRVSENGVTLFETTADSGHDYDGVAPFDVAFPTPGHYTVQALDEAGKVVAAFNGTVRAIPPGPAPHLSFQAPASAMAGAPATFTYVLQDAANQTLDHTDATFEVRRGTALVFRVHTHTHTAPESLQYAFEVPGTYTVRVVAFDAYPSATGPAFAPVLAQQDVVVSPAPPTDVGAPAMPVPPAQPLDNQVVTGTASAPYTLLGTYDPYTTAGPETQMRLTALVMDPATRMPVPHVNVHATLRGPSALGATSGPLVFASDTLHEYDGLFELATQRFLPGHYTLTVDAAKGNWTGHLEMPYDVLPPGVGMSAGPASYALSDATGLVAGLAHTLHLAATEAANQPFAHSEVDAQVLDARGFPVLQAKLHTHADGLFAWNVTLPTNGTYTLRLSPFPLDASLMVGPQKADGSTALDFPLQVAAGPGVPAILPATLAPPADAAAHPAPGAGAGMATAALAAAVAVALRRRA